MAEAILKGAALFGTLFQGLVIFVVASYVAATTFVAWTRWRALRPRPEADAEILSELRAGGPLPAIKRHRELYGSGLKDAATAIERMAHENGISLAVEAE